MGDHTGGSKERPPFEERGNRRNRPYLEEAGDEERILFFLGCKIYYRLLRRIYDPGKALMGKAIEL